MMKNSSTINRVLLRNLSTSNWVLMGNLFIYPQHAFTGILFYRGVNYSWQKNYLLQYLDYQKSLLYNYISVFRVFRRLSKNSEPFEEESIAYFVDDEAILKRGGLFQIDSAESGCRTKAFIQSFLVKAMLFFGF